MSSSMTPLQARAHLESIAHADDGDICLIESALWIAAEDYPLLDMQACKAQIEALKEGALQRVRLGETEQERISLLVDYLHHECGFRGDLKNFYDPRNSYINEVLTRRVGLPLTLAIIYLEVASRVDVPLRGISFPGHFMLMHAGEEEFFLDPCDPTEHFSAEACQTLMRSLSKDKQSTAVPVQVASKKAILSRMLGNLKLVYLRRNDIARTVSAIERLLIFNPENYQEIRDRGILYLQLEVWRFAERDLERYLPKCKSADERDTILSALYLAKERVSALH